MSRGRSNSGQHRKVEAARRVVQQALGDAARAGQPESTSKYVMAKLSEPVEHRDESVLILTIGEVAARLGISRTEVERMIAAGKVNTLTAGWSLVIPSSEVARLLAT